ncbi:MAG: hypothetical protein RLZZ500_2127 [Bacteroidota bacterium]
MSFIYSYYCAQSFSDVPPSQWTASMVQRFEKLIKLETEFRGVPLQRNSKEQLVTALKEKSQLLQFLDTYPEFAQLFQSKTDLLKEYPECHYEGFSMLQLATEVEQCLCEDWNYFIVEKLAQEQLFYLTFMLRFEAIMPEQVMTTLKNKMESVLMQYHKAIHSDSQTMDWLLYPSIVKFVVLLKDEALIQIIVDIEAKREQILREALEVIQPSNKESNWVTIITLVVFLFLVIIFLINVLNR